MPAPLVSVFIPTQGTRSALLAEAIASVLGNGFTGPLEVVVSDDSPGALAQSVVDGFQDARLRFVQPPALPSDRTAHWSFAARACRGELLFKLDDDDRLRPGFLTHTVDALARAPHAASVYTGYTHLDLHGRSFRNVIDRNFFTTRLTASSRIAEGAAYARAVLANRGGYPLNHKSAGLFRRSAAAAIGFYDLACEDFAFSAALATQGDVLYVPEVLFEYRQHPGNTTTDLSRPWRYSLQALEGLRRLSERTPLSVDLGAEWPALLSACRRALPFYYLQAALRLHGSAAAKKFLADIASELSPAELRAARRFLILTGWWPRWMHRAGFWLYTNMGSAGSAARGLG